MKMIDIIRLAAKNIFSSLKMAVSILFGFIIIMEIVMVSSGYGLAVNNYIIDIINNNSSGMYCYSMFERFNDSDMKKYKDDSKVEGIQILKNYDVYRYCEDNNKKIAAPPLANDEISFDAAIMKIDDQTYKGKNDFTYDFGLNNPASATRTEKIVKYRLGVMEEDNLQFSERELSEYKNKFNKINPFLAGEEFTGENQIILTDYMLEKFGINTDNMNCLGKKISLFIDTEDGEFCIVDNYEIGGILDSDFFRINSRTNTPQILLSNANPEYCNIFYERIFGNSFRDITEFYNNNDSDVMFIDEKTLEYAEVEAQRLLFNEVVLVICFVILIAVVVFVYIIIFFYFKKRTRYVCIQRAMGLGGGKIYLLIFSELLIMGIAAAIVAVPLCYGLILELNNVIRLAVSDSFLVLKNDFIMALGIAILFMLFMITMISVIEYRKTKEYTVVNRDKFV